jgi:hypothetical protein
MLRHAHFDIEGGKREFAANAMNKPRVVKADVGHPREQTMSYSPKARHRRELHFAVC